MKILKRLLLIHWYSYEKQIIEFDMVNFMTGATGAGKSTILDALQMVTVGETSNLFNKAANANSTRSLNGYLYGEQNDRGSGFDYMRAGKDFTSYVAAEHYDTQKKRYTTYILAADCYADLSEPTRRWVILSDRIPEDQFIDPLTGASRSLAGLKGWLEHVYEPRRYKFYDTNRTYQNDLKVYFGNVRDKYFSLFKKAVSFVPENNIAGFITDSICEVNNEINIDEMQTDIRQYKGLQNDIQRTENRISLLKEIQTASGECEILRSRAREQKYILMRADLQEAEDERTSLLNEKAFVRKEFAKNRKLLDEQLIMKKQDEEKRDDLIRERATSDLSKKSDELQQKIRQLQEKIAELQEKETAAFGFVNKIGRTWKRNLDLLDSVRFETSSEEKKLIESLHILDRNRLAHFDLQETGRLSGLRERINDERGALAQRKEVLKETVDDLEGRIERLKNGIKPYPAEVIQLKLLIIDTIKEKYDIDLDIPVLADAVELKREDWRNAIEGYLDERRFYLLVPAPFYDAARAIYEQVKEKLYGVGLVDLYRVDNEEKQISGTLAEEIEAEDPTAFAYISALLNEVHKCVGSEKPEDYPAAVTADGLLYHENAFSVIDPEIYRNPYLGRRSMSTLLNNMQGQLAVYKEQLAGVLNRYRIMDQCCQSDIISGSERLGLQDTLYLASKITQYQAAKEQARKEFERLDLTYLDELDRKIERVKEKIRECEEKISHLDTECGKLQEKEEMLAETLLPQKEQNVKAIEAAISETFTEGWIESVGLARYEAALKEERAMSLKESYNRALTATNSQYEKAVKNRNELRQRYVVEYKLAFDINNDSTEEFDHELNRLEEMELPSFRERIVDAQAKAFDKFRDDFVARLKSNIEDCRRALDELNAALRSSYFGGDRYHFTCEARKEYQNYYNMIMDEMLMDTGGSYNLLSDAFNDKYKVEIKELFDLLIMNETNDLTMESRRKAEENIRRFTDYRTYLTFDLTVTDENGVSQRLSRTMTKKSGGETQIPFYISILASFSQVCRIKSKSSDGNTIRLIIMDEALSKIDNERIRECVPLLRRFGLQAIFCAPPGMVQTFADQVDRNIAVYKDHRNHAYVRYFDPAKLASIGEEDELS